MTKVLCVFNWKRRALRVHQESALWRLARRIPAGLGFGGPGSGAYYVCPYVCLCMVIIYSLGALHNPIGVVASWCYTHTHPQHTPSYVWRVFGCVFGFGRWPLHLCDNDDISYSKSGYTLLRGGRDVVHGWCTTCVVFTCASTSAGMAAGLNSNNNNNNRR